MAILGCPGRAERKMPARFKRQASVGNKHTRRCGYLVRDLLVLDLDERVVMSARSGGIHIRASRVAELVKALAA